MGYGLRVDMSPVLKEELDDIVTDDSVWNWIHDVERNRSRFILQSFRTPLAGLAAPGEFTVICGVIWVY
jgi:hypothetical protein